MISEDAQKIIALTVLYLLYAMVPILIFFILFVTSYIVFLILNLVIFNNVVSYYSIILHITIDALLILLTYKLVKWLRK
ncbi:MAG: hypothetical protein ACP6IU_09475 [Candidatus Asgardarchaeia archaeon]